MATVIELIHEEIKKSDNFLKNSTDLENILLQDDTQYYEKLINLGFVSVEGIDKHVHKISRSKKDRDLHAWGQTFINFYKLNFPLYSLITLKDMILICEKYNLFFGKVRFYKNLIPTKNVEDIEKFIKYYDNLKGKNTEIRTSSIYHNVSNPLLYDTVGQSLHKPSTENRPNLHITAPQSHFDIRKGVKIIEHSIVKLQKRKNILSILQENIQEKKRQKLLEEEIKDPIVWAPVRFPALGGACLILTKWGEEASYPEFANPIEN